MKRRNAGVIWVAASIVILLLGIGVRVKAQTRTVSWSAVTSYTDGTPIEPGNAVTYSVWRQDNVTSTVVQIANRISGTSTTFDDSSLVKGRPYNFWGQAHLATGASSDNSAVYAWVNPLGKASPPAGWQVN